MSDLTPGTWPGLGADGESMAAGDAGGQHDRETMALTAGLTDALQGMAGELKAVREQLEAMARRQDRADKLNRRLRHVVIALAVSFALDITLTILVTFFALQAHSASAQANATIEQLHETQIAACEIGNQTLAKEILLWTHIAAAAKPSTAAQRKADDQLLSFIRATFAPRPCARIYRLR